MKTYKILLNDGRDVSARTVRAASFRQCSDEQSNRYVFYDDKGKAFRQGSGEELNRYVFYDDKGKAINVMQVRASVVVSITPVGTGDDDE
jgi:hypothetical protein